MPVGKIRFKVLQLVVFSAVCIAAFAIFYVHAGGTSPFAAKPYEVRFVVGDAAGLVPNADVRADGVEVGRVLSVRADANGEATVLMTVDDTVAPLADNAHVRIRLKTPLGEAYVAITPGTRNAGMVPSGGTLPTGDTVPQVQLDQILSVFNPQTRQRLRADLSDLSSGLAGRGEDLNEALSATEPTFQQGKQLMGLLSRQRNQLAGVVANTSTLLSALATRSSDLERLVDAVDTTAGAAAARDDSIAATVKALPSALVHIRGAADELVPLANVATPVLANLTSGAVALHPTLTELIPAAKAGSQLLGLLPAAVKRANPLLTGLKRFSSAAPALTTALPKLLCQLNPMLTYLDPYRNDIGSFFGNVGMTTDDVDQYGRNPIVVFPTVDTSTLQYDDSLLTTTTETMLKSLGVPYEPMQYNPYPAPNTVSDPQPWNGQVPRVTSDCTS